MAMEKPWFGWGLESYADVFRIYNSQRTAERWVPYYAEAHNDWFQSFAETGAAGTALLVLLGLLPLARERSGLVGSLIPRYLLFGCGLVLLYAWVEFPLANPAVMIAFWLSLYTAVRLAELGRLRHSSPAH
jgi:O-antigen ligase